ncbi:MAG: hypothetical protein L3J41_11680 [Melioribacteraceae bacterium]|nr:hypothetical protein [Melioribacteraceae bacterium]
MKNSSCLRLFVAGKEYKQMKTILFITITTLLISCAAQRSIEYLAKMKYKIHSVTDFEVEGVSIDGKSQLGDFSPSDLLRLVPAFSRGELNASFTLNLLVQNPNPANDANEILDIEITALPWELFVNDNKILTGNISEPIHLKGNISEEKIPIKIHFNVSEILNKGSVNDLLKTVLKFGGKNSSTSNITLFAQPEIGTIIGNISTPNPIKIVDYEFR